MTAEHTKSRKALQLWWWQAHNHVNLRVGELEGRYGDGDPAYPKALWPTKAQCPECHRPGGVPWEAIVGADGVDADGVHLLQLAKPPRSSDSAESTTWDLDAV